MISCQAVHAYFTLGAEIVDSNDAIAIHHQSKTAIAMSPLLGFHIMEHLLYYIYINGYVFVLVWVLGLLKFEEIPVGRRKHA